MHGSAVRFNGSSDTLILDGNGYATVNDSVVDQLGDLDKKISISVWFKKTRQSSKQVIFQLASKTTGKRYLELSIRRRGFKITVSYLKRANKVTQNIHFDLGFTVEDGQWYHLLSYFDYPNVILYLNGTRMQQTTSKAVFDDHPDSSNAEMRLGSAYPGQSNSFIGHIGHVYLIQGVNLTSNDIQCLISCGQWLQFSSSDNPIVGSLDRWKRTLTLTGDDTRSYYESALQTVKYKAYGPSRATVTLQVRTTFLCHIVSHCVTLH